MGSLLCTGSTACAQLDQDPDHIHQQSVEYRDAITLAGQLDARVHARHCIDGPSPQESLTQLRFWFSGDKLRIDISEDMGEAPSGDRWEHFVVSDSTYLWIPSGEFQGVIAPLVDFVNVAGGVREHFHLFHPKMFGLGVANESLMERNPDARIVRLKGGRGAEVVPDVLDGVQVWKLISPLKYPSTDASQDFIPGELVCWFSPDCGWNLVRGEMRELGNHYRIVKSVTSKLKQYPPYNYWFPEQIIRETKANDRITDLVVTTITHGVLGEPPTDSQFLPESMDLPSGKTVVDRTAGPKEIVNASRDGKLIPLTGPEVHPAPSERPKWIVWFLALNSLVFAVLAGVALIGLIRHRHGPRR